MRGFVLGLLLATLAATVSPRQSAQEMQAGDVAQFAGVLVTEAQYRRMAQALLDLPLKDAEIKAWQRGHALAIDSMEKALASLRQCEPRRSTAEKVLGTVSDLALLAVPLYCISRTEVTVSPER